MPEREYEALAAELVALGGTLPDPAPESGLALAVMERVADLPRPTAGHPAGLPQLAGALARHRGRLAVVVTALLLSLFAAPPVRAAVADWFGFAGVVVHHDPAPSSPSSAPPPPTVDSNGDLEKAKQLLAFQPLVPAALGAPQGVEVSPDRRLLSMSWTTARGAVRLDEFDGQLDYTFAKTARDAVFTSVAGDFALWFDEPHDVVVLNPDGSSRRETARLAGHTLIWQRGGTTLRLEGQLTLGRAIAIAESATKP